MGQQKLFKLRILSKQSVKPDHSHMVQTFYLHTFIHI